MRSKWMLGEVKRDDMASKSQTGTARRDGDRPETGPDFGHVKEMRFPSGQSGPGAPSRFRAAHPGTGKHAHHQHSTGQHIALHISASTIPSARSLPTYNARTCKDELSTHKHTPWLCNAI